MPNVTQPPDNPPDEPPGPHITPYFTAALEAEAARRGLPPEPWAA